MHDPEFIGRRGKHNVYLVECPNCESEMELGIRIDCTALIPHDHCRSVFFIQRLPDGKRLNDQPRLEMLVIQQEARA